MTFTRRRLQGARDAFPNAAASTVYVTTAKALTPVSVFLSQAGRGTFRKASTAMVAKDSLDACILSWQVFLHTVLQTKQNPLEGQQTGLNRRLCIEMENQK